MILTARDNTRMAGLHPDLIAIVRHAAGTAGINFMVIEGLRTIEKQREYFAAGKSKTMRSRHLTGHAIDIAPLIDLDNDGDLDLSWRASDFEPLALAMKSAARYLGLPIEWGGDWKSFHDAPHFQLPWEFYP